MGGIENETLVPFVAVIQPFQRAVDGMHERLHLSWNIAIRQSISTSVDIYGFRCPGNGGKGAKFPADEPGNGDDRHNGHENEDRHDQYV